MSAHLLAALKAAQRRQLGTGQGAVPPAGSAPATMTLARLPGPPEGFPDEALVDVACPLCQGTSSSLLMYGCDRLFGRPGQYRVVRCDACRMKYVNPRPTFEALGPHYPSDYFPVRLPDTMSPLGRALTRILYHVRWTAYLRKVERVLGRIPAETNVVDVGCGTNGMLSLLARVRGVDGLGVDFDRGVVTYIRERLKMRATAGTLMDAKLEADSYDLVTMSEYLEHEPDPCAVLREARRISKTGAHLVIEVPFTSGLPARTFGTYWSQLDVPRHLCFYTPETLGKMLERHGYRLMYVNTFGAPFSIGLSVLQRLGFRRLGRMGPFEALIFFVLGVVLAPVAPCLREFMFAVAQAE
jgi:ubiquinone/menaquinone biosynthesis C-methylase UbiE